MERASDSNGRSLRLVSGAPAPLLPTLASPAADEVVLAADRAGDGRALVDALVRAHGAAVVAIVRRYARATQDARDLAVECFLRTLAAARRTLRADPQRAIPFRRALLRSALRVSRRHLRDELCVAGARLELLGRDGPPPLRLPPPRGAEEEARMRRVVLRLPAREREVLTLRADPGLSFQEIASVLRITEPAVALCFHAAAEKLRAAAGAGGATACARWAVLLSAQAAGALERIDGARVDAHLAGCGACRAVRDATAGALERAAVGRSEPRGEALAAELPARVAAALRRAERLASPRRLLVAAAVAALAVTLAAAAVLRALG